MEEMCRKSNCVILESTYVYLDLCGVMLLLILAM